MSNTVSYVENNGYIILPVATNPNTIYQNAVKAINTSLPGWIPRESHLEVILLEQFAAMCAEAANVAAAVPLNIFSYYGALIGITPKQGAYATALTTWTMVDSKGYTIPANTTVGYQVLGNQLYTFSLPTELMIAATTTQAHTVQIRATQIGTIFNQLPPHNLVLVSPALTFITSVASVTPTSGGETLESLPSYLNRLSQELQLLTPRPILTPDFAILAQNVTGVYRASAYNNLNPFANNLATQDATFVGGNGTWTATSGCTLSNVTGPSGKSSMKITATGTANAVATSGSYNVPQNAFCMALLSLDYGTAKTTVLSVECFDIAGAPLTATPPTASSSSTVHATTGSTHLLTLAQVGFTTPPHTTHVKLKVTVSSPGATDHQYVVFPGLFLLDAEPVNLVPDSTAYEVTTALTWKFSTGMSQEIFATHQYGFVVTGTATSAPIGTLVANSEWFYLPAGTYFVSAYIDATNVTLGSPKFTIAGHTLTQTAGQKSTLSTTFTLATPLLTHASFNTNNCTIQAGLPLTFASPFLKGGSTPKPYVAGPSWSPPNQIHNNERMVTVACVDVGGTPLDSVVEASVASYLESLREVNFVVNVIGPSYTTIDVNWSGFVTTASANDVQTAATTALKHYLTPAYWAGGTQTPPTWSAAQTVVRYLEVATILGETPGLTLTGLTIGFHGGSMGTSDLTMQGFAPLPKWATINPTVTVQT